LHRFVGMMTNPIKGHTLRWTFEDGPTRGKTFEHTFGKDGSVTYKMAGSDQTTKEKHYEVELLHDDIVAVSYLTQKGWTLTVLLDYEDHTAIGFASNEDQLVVQHGHFEAID
jgi:hypothetical protein